MIWRTDALAACHGATSVSLITFIPLYMRVVQGVTVSEIGLLVLPLSVGVGLGSLMTGRAVSRTGRHCHLSLAWTVRGHRDAGRPGARRRQGGHDRVVGPAWADCGLHGHGHGRRAGYGAKCRRSPCPRRCCGVGPALTVNRGGLGDRARQPRAVRGACGARRGDRPPVPRTDTARTGHAHVLSQPVRVHLQEEVRGAFVAALLTIAGFAAMVPPWHGRSQSGVSDIGRRHLCPPLRGPALKTVKPATIA